MKDSENQKVKEFKRALKTFGENIPTLADEIRSEISKLYTNRKYIEKLDNFVEHCRKFINPYFERQYVEDLLIQHILTEQIFLKVFDEQEYHKNNNISKTISEIEREFLSDIKADILQRIQPYVDPITNYGNNIIDLNERQLFLKNVYQKFYNSYNKKIADRFGIVYTPNEIVKFIVKSTDDILKKHFDKNLSDKGVQILDPATGTGTFLTEIIQQIYDSSDYESLKYKYENEIHANEISVLPYYVANLSIEHTFKSLTGQRSKFPNLVLVDSLQKRIKKQNEKDIRIVTGNPPWNQHQKDFRDNNPNKKYTEIKRRIDETYGDKYIYKKDDVKKRKLTQDKCIYFLRWSSDRIDKQGIISFVINRSFIDCKSGIGVRYSLEKEFDYIYIVDLGGNLREGDPNGSNVFDIQTGNTLVFLVKTNNSNKYAKIKYLKLSDHIDGHNKSYKLKELNDKSLKTYLEQKNFKEIIPNKKHQWINQETYWNGFYINDIFDSFLGISTCRDNDVYDIKKETLEKRMSFLISDLNQNPEKPKIKLSSDLKQKISSGKCRNLSFDSKKIALVAYRVSDVRFYYCEKILSDRLTNNFFDLYGCGLEKKELSLVWGIYSSGLRCDLVDIPISSDYLGVNSGAKTRISALKKIKNDYFKLFKKKQNLKKEDIFSYVVGLFHSDKYKKFIQDNNFNKDNPPIPIWDFEKYRKLGEKKIRELKEKTITP